MRHHMDDADAHQGGEPDRRPRIVRESEKRAAIRDQSAVQRDALTLRHGVLAHTEVDVAGAEVVAGHSRLRLDPRCRSSR